MIQDNITAVDDAAKIDLPGTVQTLNIQVTGTWVGTLVFEASVDAEATWFAVQVGQFPDLTQVSSTAANGQFSVLTAAFDAFRVRASAWTSGTAVVALATSSGLKLRPTAGAGAPGPQGPQGSPGMPGLPGEEGEVGEQGFPGPPGPAGSAGAQGPQGSPGMPGLDGLDGADGEAGPPGPTGPTGADGATGPQGVPGSMGMPGIDGEDGVDGQPGIPGAAGVDGAAGATGAQGQVGMPGLDGEDGLEGMPGAPGAAGAAGAAGAQGSQGPPGPPGMDAEEPEYPYLIPGPTGPQGPAGGGGGSITTVEVNLGSTASHRGKFTVTDAAITPSSKVAIWQAPGPYTGKGTRADEAEMDPLWCVAEPGSGQATVYWRTMAGVVTTYSEIKGMQPIATGTNQGVNRNYPEALIQRTLGRVRGNVKFHYMVAS